MSFSLVTFFLSKDLFLLVPELDIKDLNHIFIVAILFKIIMMFFGFYFLYESINIFYKAVIKKKAYLEADHVGLYSFNCKTDQKIPWNKIDEINSMTFNKKNKEDKFIVVSMDNPKKYVRDLNSFS